MFLVVIGNNPGGFCDTVQYKYETSGKHAQGYAPLIPEIFQNVYENMEFPPDVPAGMLKTRVCEKHKFPFRELQKKIF